MAVEIFKWGWLRKLFGLDRTVSVEPSFGDREDLTARLFGNAGSWYASQTNLENQRRASYIDFEAMDYYPVLSSALDVFASDATQYDLSSGASIWAVSNNQKAADIVNEMFQRVLEPNLFGIARALAKYGDVFEQILYSDDRIEAINYVQPDIISRVEDMYGRLLGFTPGLIEGPPFRALPGERLPEPLSTPWDFVHFRILGHDRNSVHGHSLLRPARRIWRQTKIIEDSMVLYRLNRAPDHLVFYIDVGNMSREEQFRAMNAWRHFIRKNFFRDRTAGRFEQEYDPNTVDQNIYWPTSTGSQSKVERLTGSNNVGDIGDVEYFRDMLFAGIKIPKAYLGFEGDVNAKATLAQQDVRYARTLKTLTRSLIEGAMRLAQIELVLHGINPLDEELILEVRTAPASYLDELQRSELISIRLELTERLLEMGHKMNFNMARWAAYILYNYMDMSVNAIKTFLNPEGPQAQPGFGGVGGMGLGGVPGEFGGEEPSFGPGEPIAPPTPPPGEELPPGAQPPQGEFGLDVASNQRRADDTLRDIVENRTINWERLPEGFFNELYKLVNGNRRVDLFIELDREMNKPERVKFDERAPVPPKTPTPEHSANVRRAVEGSLRTNKEGEE